MSERYANLQALRGVACLMVVMFHGAGHAEQWYAGFRHNVLRPALWFGYAGVDVFFVLSGFIITMSAAKHLGRPSAAPGFLFRRVWRVYPVFWVVLGLEVLYYGFAMGIWEWPKLDNVLLLPTKGNGLPSRVIVSWSLTYEMYFYCVFALLILLPRRLGIAALASWGLVPVAAYALAQTGVWGSANRFLVVALSGYVFEFYLGCVVAGLVSVGCRRGGLACVAAGVLWAAAGLGLTLRHHSEWNWLSNNIGLHILTFGPPSALVVYGLAASELTGRLRLTRWLQAVGDWSYSIYLTHCVVLWCATLVAVYVLRMKHTVLADTLWCASFVAVSVAVGWALHRLAERPLMSLVKKKSAGRAVEVPVVTRESYERTAA